MNNDLISRQAAIEIIQSMYPGMPRVPWMLKNWKKQYEPYIRLEEEIKGLPPAQPEQRWIPVTERLPEYGIEVVTVDKDGDYEINHIIDEEDGKWYWRGAIAWMHLPEYHMG